MSPGPRSTARAANLSAPRVANRCARSSWVAARTCTAKCSAARNAGRLREGRDRLHSTMGGFNETELKLFAVNPMSWPAASRVVTMVTPVAKAPRARRNCWELVTGAGLITSALRGALHIRGFIISPRYYLPSVRNGTFISKLRSHRPRLHAAPVEEG